ncbi:hypothetical protein EDC01DRAFT_775989 [Geopyxis carbonaria]|nr:hypothetical protein EDC01DRAFT_775989 [Geopyxis carbonaria]
MRPPDTAADTSTNTTLFCSSSSNNTTSSSRPPPRRLLALYPELNRSLNGSSVRLPTPPPVPLPTRTIASLDSPDPPSLRTHILLGASLCPPYDVLTLASPRPPSLLGGGRVPSAALHHWRLTPSGHLQHHHITPGPVPPSPSTPLHAVYTALTTSDATVLQVLFYRIPRRPPHSCPLALQFRSGTSFFTYPTPLSWLPHPPSVCFGGVTDSTSSTIRVLAGGVLLLYHPHIGRTRTLDLAALATRVAHGVCTPERAKSISAFLPSPPRETAVAWAGWDDYRCTVVACVFTVDLTGRVRTRVAKTMSSPRLAHAWDTQPYALMATVLEKAGWAAAAALHAGGEHRCGGEGSDDVHVLHRFVEAGEASVERVECAGLGFGIVGWGEDGGVQEGEDAGELRMRSRELANIALEMFWGEAGSLHYVEGLGMIPRQW